VPSKQEPVRERKPELGQDPCCISQLICSHFTSEAYLLKFLIYSEELMTVLTPEIVTQSSQGQKNCLVRVMTVQRLNLRLPYESASRYSRIMLSLFSWLPRNSPYRTFGVTDCGR